MNNFKSINYIDAYQTLNQDYCDNRFPDVYDKKSKQLLMDATPSTMRNGMSILFLCKYSTPRTKVIMSIREPVSRTYSNFKHVLKNVVTSQGNSLYNIWSNVPEDVLSYFDYTVRNGILNIEKFMEFEKTFKNGNIPRAFNYHALDEWEGPDYLYMRLYYYLNSLNGLNNGDIWKHDKNKGKKPYKDFMYPYPEHMIDGSNISGCVTNSLYNLQLRLMMKYFPRKELFIAKTSAFQVKDDNDMIEVEHVKNSTRELLKFIGADRQGKKYIEFDNLPEDIQSLTFPKSNVNDVLELPAMWPSTELLFFFAKFEKEFMEMIGEFDVE